MLFYAGLETPGGPVAIGHQIFQMATGFQSFVARRATDFWNMVAMGYYWKKVKMLYSSSLKPYFQPLQYAPQISQSVVSVSIPNRYPFELV